MACGIESDNAFGPSVSAECRGGFDFTLLFEELFLSIAPLVVVSLLIPLRVRELCSRTQNILVGAIYHLKLVGYVTLSSEHAQF